jgi:hypothetical protein
VTSQFSTQATSLHVTVSLVTPQPRPPWLGCVWMIFVRDFSPSPQSTEHALNAFQPAVTQLMGHGLSLHTSTSFSAGQV